MKFSSRQLLAFAGVAVLMVGLGILVALAQQRRDLRERVDTEVGAIDNVLNCDPGPDPYNSNTMTVLNNSTQALEGLRFDVHRCEYVPGIIEQYRGSFKCEPGCSASEPNCLEGVWDSGASNQGFSLQPGESRTFSAAANPCEIIQVDAQNPAADNGNGECHNVRSSNTVQPGEIWPGGIAFGISENATGYPNCEQPTATPTPTTPAPTATPTTPPSVPTNTPTPQPTAPPGQPTYTPIPTATPTTPFVPTATPTTPFYTPVPTSTPQPTIPVSGNAAVTGLGILGAIGLVVVAVLAL